MKTPLSSKALILKSTPFKDNKIILHLFSENFGLLSAFYTVKKTAYLSSMMLIEGGFHRGRGDLYTLSDPHILDTFPHLRTDFSLLQLSSKLIHLLSKVLVKDREVFPLFSLTKNTLKAFSTEGNNLAIYSCYLLKLLLFEGLLPLQPEALDSTLDEDEKLTYLTLATAKNFASLKKLIITARLEKGIEEYVRCAVGGT